jgi:hypothetical protein
MLIIWGRKIKRRRVGYVADYCPVCRAQRVFELQDVRSAGHVYYISLGRGTLLGQERRCSDCGTSFKANTASYAGVSKTQLSLEELRQRTFPNLDAATREQAALDERIRRQRLSPTERQALIRAPFVYLASKVERRFANTHIDAGVGVAFLALVGLFLAAPAALKLLPANSAPVVFLILIAVGGGLVVWQVRASGSRFMKREIVPVLAKSLGPLQPTEEEIKLVLGELKKVKQKIGWKLKASDLVEGMQTATL